MSSNGAFVLPAGVRLSMEGDALSIHNAGDIVIEGAPAGSLHTLSSESGDIVLAPPSAVKLSSISAPGGTVTVRGKVTTESINAKSVHFESGTLKAKVIKASESISLSGSKLEATVVVAPNVTVEPSIKGRATAIQSDNEIGPHKLKGGFSLAEFVDMIPNGSEMLASFDIEVAEEDDDDDEDDDQSAAVARAAAPAAADLDAAAPDDDDDVSIVEDDDDVEDELLAEVTPDDEAGPIREAMLSIADAYREGDLPEPIGVLTELVDGGDFKKLKEDVNRIWSELLKYHQQTDPYIPNTVTRGFQTIQLELRKL